MSENAKLNNSTRPRARRRRRGRNANDESGATEGPNTDEAVPVSTGNEQNRPRRRRRKIKGPIPTTGPGGFNKNGRLDRECDRELRDAMFSEQALNIARFMRKRDFLRYNKEKNKRTNLVRDLFPEVRSRHCFEYFTNFREVLVISPISCLFDGCDQQCEVDAEYLGAPVYDIKIVICWLNLIVCTPDVRVTSPGIYIPDNIQYDGYRLRIHRGDDGKVSDEAYVPSIKEGEVVNPVVPNIFVFQTQFQGLIYEVWQYDNTAFPNILGYMKIPERVIHRLLSDFTKMCDVATTKEPGLQSVAAKRVIAQYGLVPK